MEKFHFIFLKRIYVWLITIYSISLLGPANFSSIVLIAMTVFAIWDIFNHKVYFKIDDKYFLPTVLFFSFHLIGLLYTSNMKQGVDDVLRIASFVILPVIFFRIRSFPNFNIKPLIKIFIVSLGICSIFFLSSEDKVDYYFHPSYLGMYINLSIFFCYFLILKSTDRFESILLKMMIVFFVGTLFATASRMQILLGGITNLGGLLLLLFKAGNRKGILTAGLFIIGIAVLASLVMPTPARDKFKKLMVEGTDFIRERNWSTNMELISKNWLFGVGTGDSIDELNKLRNPDWHEYFENYNSHSQYLETTAKLGVGGLLVLLMCFTIPMVYGFKNNNYLLIAFSLIFALSCLTESMLQRQKGICFFTLFYYILNVNKTHPENGNPD